MTILIFASILIVFILIILSFYLKNRQDNYQPLSTLSPLSPLSPLSEISEDVLKYLIINSLSLTDLKNFALTDKTNFSLTRDYLKTRSLSFGELDNLIYITQPADILFPSSQEKYQANILFLQTLERIFQIFRVKRVFYSQTLKDERVALIVDLGRVPINISNEGGFRPIQPRREYPLGVNIGRNFIEVYLSIPRPSESMRKIYNLISEIITQTSQKLSEFEGIRVNLNHPSLRDIFTKLEVTPKLWEILDAEEGYNTFFAGAEKGI